MEPWIRSHPLPAFFLLALAICFGTLFPAIYLVPRDTTLGQIFGFSLGKLGAFSPVIAGVIVARAGRPEKLAVPAGRRLMVFLPLWLAATAVSVADLKLTAPPGVPFAGLALLSLPVALLPAWVLSSAFHGTHGIRKMLATLIRPKGNAVYYLAALLTFPAVHVLGAGLTNVMGGRAWFPREGFGADLATTTLVTFLSVLLFAGGLNEESGWRGFAQQRLQRRCSPLVTALLLWAFMVVWHIPNDLLQYRDGGYLQVRIGLYPFITVLFSWVYNRTRGSIPAVAIFHASMNSMNPLMGILPITQAGNLLLMGFAVAVAVFDRMWRHLPEDHPAVHQEEHMPPVGKT